MGIHKFIIISPLLWFNKITLSKKSDHTPHLHCVLDWSKSKIFSRTNEGLCKAALPTSLAEWILRTVLVSRLEFCQTVLRPAHRIKEE